MYRVKIYIFFKKMDNAEDENLRERILRAYSTPGHPVAFSAPHTVAKFFNISQSLAKKILEHDEGYTIHREYKQPKFYNPFYVHGRREQVQGDLIDVSRIAASNNSIKFLLLLIDVFSKKIWVYPLKNKSATSMERVIRSWLESIDVKPVRLATDRGLEFRNQRLQNILTLNNVEWQALGGTMKAAVAERANKTIQILIYKYLTEKETTRYDDVLQRLVETYNKRGHRSLNGMSPQNADLPRNENEIRAIHHARYEKIAQKRKSHLPYKVGDLVRIKTQAKKISSSSRAYAEQFKGEYFRVVRINRTLPIAMYHLRSLDTGEMIEGGFYAQELQRQRGNVYKIERVLRRRVRRGVREIYVKWKNFGPQWNEWIPEANVVAVY